MNRPLVKSDAGLCAALVSDCGAITCSLQARPLALPRE